MLSFRNGFRWAAVATLGVAAVLFGASSAEAAFKLRISTNGGGTFPTVIEDNQAGDTNSAVGIIQAAFTLPGGGSVNFTLNSNRTQNGPFGRLSQTELAVGGSSDIDFGSSVFVIDVTDTSYTAPTGPSQLTSEASGTGLSGLNASRANVTFQSWADDANAEFGMGAFTGGPQGPFVNTNFGGPNPPDTVLSFGSVNPPFSLTSRFIVTNAFIPQGGSLQLTGTATLAPAAVPEPATIVMLLAGLPALGVFSRRWRRETKA